MDADGSKVVRLTTTGIEDELPSWAPDGSRIAFDEGKDAHDIYVMNADGSHVQRLTTDSKSSWPSWSPDGTKIAFTHNETSKLSDIWVMGSDGSGARAVTSDGSDWGPSWQ
jgi:TolB protein